LVHGLDHGGVAEDLFFVAKFYAVNFCGFLFVFFDEIGASDEGGVDGVEGEVYEEGFVLIRFDELAGVGSEAVGEVDAFGAFAEFGVFEWREIFFTSVGAASFPSAGVEVVSLFGGPEFFGGSEVPFAGEEGGVSLFFEGLGDGHFIEVHAIV